MNKKKKTFLGILGLAAFLGLAVFAYQTLSARFKPEINLQTPSAAMKSEQTSASESSTEKQPAEDRAGEENSSGEETKIPAPDFTAIDAQGNEVKLSDYIGKPIVLNFWASWCPPCKGEMPDFEEVFKERGDEILFLMVNMTDGQRETKAKGEKYISEQGFTFPVLYDTEQNAAYTYGVYSLPTTYFIDKDGNLIAGAETAIDKETLLKGIGMIAPDSE